jgi:large subunit ribosomal protein L27
MAHRKAGGTARNLRDSNPQYLGVKIADGQKAKTGAIIVRQRGTDVLPGDSVEMGKDHTLHAMKDGIVKFGTKRKKGFDNKVKVKKIVHII